MTAFAGKVSELGFSHIEINYVIPQAGLETLLNSNHVEVSSIHSPCPRVKWVDGRTSEGLNLASLDPDERTMAVDCARTTIDHAVTAGAPAIVVHLGGIGNSTFEEERDLRRMYDTGKRAGDEVELLRRQALLRRREGAREHFPEARRSLAEIAEYAVEKGITVGLENRFHYHEFPSIDEMHDLLDEYPPDVVGFWLDMGHAVVLDRLGLVPGKRWLDELADRCAGSHIHDVDGLADHRAPGNGTADWDHIAEKLPPSIPRVLEINQHEPEERVAGAAAFLRERRVLPS